MTDPSELWDFDDPAGSEQRFRAAAETAEGSDRLVLLTQVARALGLQERYDEGHAVLDDLAVDDPEVATRASLERGRLLRSAGEPDAARPHFEAAAGTAREAGLEALHVDALHMVALVAPAEDQQRLTEEALAVARGSARRDGPQLGRQPAQQPRHDPRRRRGLARRAGGVRGGAGRARADR